MREDLERQEVRSERERVNGWRGIRRAPAQLQRMDWQDPVVAPEPNPQIRRNGARFSKDSTLLRSEVFRLLRMAGKLVDHRGLYSPMHQRALPLLTEKHSFAAVDHVGHKRLAPGCGAAVVVLPDLVGWRPARLCSECRRCVYDHERSRQEWPNQ